MTRHHYNELRTYLKDSFVKRKDVDKGYGLFDGVGDWVKQSGITPRVEHTNIIVKIFGSVPYPYQQQDRTKILKFLRANRYGKFLIYLRNL